MAKVNILSKYPTCRLRTSYLSIHCFAISSILKGSGALGTVMYCADGTTLGKMWTNFLRVHQGGKYGI